MSRRVRSLVSTLGKASARRAAAPASSTAPPSQRVLSLDALRGLTMFWIIGGRELFLSTVALLYPPLLDAVETQVTHPEWEGFVVWDLIMPMFLFVVGAAMPFALGKRLTQDEGRGPTYWRIARRVTLLWVLGMIAQESLLKYQVQGLELYSNTLQAIAVGYLVTSLALLHLPRAGQVLLFAALVLGYAALLMFVPFGDHPAGTLERTANFARYVDELVLGPYRRDHDYTWVITSMSFAATVLLGALAGHVLRSRLKVEQKLLLLTALGVGCLWAGWLWSYWLPLNRHLWTSSMILWSGGWSFLVLVLFYAVIDVADVKRWTFPFVVIGANALLAYVFSHVYGGTLSDVWVMDLARQLPEAGGELLRAVAEFGLLWLILWYLYRNRTFLRA